MKDNIIEKVNPVFLCQYLKNAGWNELGEGSKAFEKGCNVVEVTDDVNELQNAIYKVSEVEGKSVGEITSYLINMKHLGTETIKTERLKLRKFRIDDAEPMFRNWANSEAVTKYLTWEPHKDINETKTVIKKWISQYASKKRYNWAIKSKSLGEVIGNISVVNWEDEDTAVIGYCIGEEWWNQGYTSEALSATIDFLFNKVGITCIKARHDPENIHSGMVMKKCGMKYEKTDEKGVWHMLRK